MGAHVIIIDDEVWKKIKATAVLRKESINKTLIYILKREIDKYLLGEVNARTA